MHLHVCTANQACGRAIDSANMTCGRVQYSTNHIMWHWIVVRRLARAKHLVCREKLSASQVARIYAGVTTHCANNVCGTPHGRARSPHGRPALTNTRTSIARQRLRACARATTSQSRAYGPDVHRLLILHGF